MALKPTNSKKNPITEVEFRQKLKNKDGDFKNRIFNFAITRNLLQEALGLAEDGNIHFNFDLDFFNVEFQKDVSFNGVLFSKETYFRKAKFLGEANFYQAEFSKKVNFRWTRFSNEGYFREAIFKDETSFLGATFLNRASFRLTKFFNKADFSLVVFSESYPTHFCDLNTKQIKYLSAPKLLFKNTIFSEKFLFCDCDLSKTVFEECSVQKAKFVSCEFLKVGFGIFRRDSFTTSTKSTNKTEKNRKDREYLCCQMKTALESSKKWRQAGDFYIGELEARRSKNWWEYLKLTCFKYLLGYAERISILFISITILFFVAALILGDSLCGFSFDGCFVNYNWSYFEFDFEKAAKSTIFPLTLRLELKAGDAIKFWETVFLIASWVLWITLAVAIRRRFRF